MPLAQWFRKDLKSLFGDMLEDRAFRERGVFVVDGVRAAFERHLAGRQDMSEMLWMVLTYEMWARNFADGSATRGLAGGSA